MKHKSLSGIDEGKISSALASVSEILSRSCAGRSGCSVDIALAGRPTLLGDLNAKRTLDYVSKVFPRYKPRVADLSGEVKLANEQGIFPFHAAASLLDGALPRANTAQGGIPEVTIYLVRKISSGCPETPAVHMWGCAAILGSSAVIAVESEQADPLESASRLKGEWSHEDHLIWAHEISHLLGLWDLDVTSDDSLLMGVRRSSGAAGLLAIEVSVVCSYPPPDRKRSDAMCSQLTAMKHRATCGPISATTPLYMPGVKIEVSEVTEAVKTIP